MEKLFVDPKRFSANKIRRVPCFSNEYRNTTLPTAGARKPLSVLYLIHYFYPTKKGGTERFTLNIAKEQQRLGNRATVLVLEANEPLSIYTERCGEIYYRYYEYDGVPCIAFRHKRAPLGLYYKSINLNDTEMKAFAAHLIDKHQFDVVHATYPQPFASFLTGCKKIGIPYIVTCTDFCMMCHYSTMVDNNGDFCIGTEEHTKCAHICPTYGCKNFRERFENARTVLQDAHFVTVPSEFVACVMGREFPDVAFLPIAHGVSEVFSFSRRNGQVRKFVYAGTLTLLKGVHLLIDAFSALENQDITLDIYGDGDKTYLDKLKAQADERVVFHGAVSASEMPRIYSEADCVIVPSMWYETYNFVLREALSTGALVLASEIGAMPEAVDVGKNGFLFAPADGAGLTEAMKNALNFDFAQYERRTFPTTKDEGIVYSHIYNDALQKK